MYPIKASKLSVTSYYGNRTYTYQGKKVSDFHSGIDLIANPRDNNAEIVAFDDGTVTAVQKTGAQYGTACYVRISHGNGWYTLYYHLKSGSIVVNKGDKVKRGQKIGIIGTTGVSTGVHLHFQIDKGSNSSAVNPYDYVFNGKELPKPTPTPSSFTTGNYKCNGSMNVRSGAGTNYAIKKVSQLTADGKKHATSTNPNANAVYKAGTIFTAQQIINQNGVWAKTPSGYVCIKGASGTVYCTKC